MSPGIAIGWASSDFKADTLLVNYTRLNIGLGFLQLKPLAACFFICCCCCTEFESASFIHDIFIDKSKIVKKSFEKLLKKKRNQ